MKQAFFLARYTIRRFFQDHCLNIAASLSYTTLLALVPLMAVSVAILAAFPAFQSVIGALQDFIFANFVPASGDTIQQYLQQFAEQAAKLTALGVVFLVLTAVMLMDTIEGALNEIWRVHRKRRPVARFLVYWAILTLGPILVGLSLVVSSYLFSLPLISDATTGLGLGTAFLRVLPFLATAIAFGLLYMIVPNCTVAVRHALVGGIAAAILFEGAKKAFAMYITHVPTYALIYGALAAVPVFLIWIYISWAITLIGAQLTFALANYRTGSTDGRDYNEGARLIVTFHILEHLWQAQDAGRSLSSTQLLAMEEALGDTRLAAILEQLEEHHLIHRTASSEWALSRDLEAVTLENLLHAIHIGVLPDYSSEKSPLCRVIEEARQRLSDITQISLKQLLVSSQSHD